MDSGGKTDGGSALACEGPQKHPRKKSAVLILVLYYEVIAGSP